MFLNEEAKKAVAKSKEIFESFMKRFKEQIADEQVLAGVESAEEQDGATVKLAWLTSPSRSALLIWQKGNDMMQLGIYDRDFDDWHEMAANKPDDLGFSPVEVCDVINGQPTSESMLHALCHVLILPSSNMIKEFERADRPPLLAKPIDTQNLFGPGGPFYRGTKLSAEDKPQERPPSQGTEPSAN